MGWGAALGGAFGSVLNFGLGMSNQQNQNVLNAQQLAFAREQMERNTHMQYEFASNGLRWRAADARAAGIHPLFAMGAPTTSFAPSVVGYNPSSGGVNYGDLAGSMAQMGQGIERAINAGSTNQERMARLHEAQHLMALQTERAELENNYIRVQTMRAMSQIGPGFPSNAPTIASGGGALGPFESKPPEITTATPGNPGLASGPAIPITQFGWSPTNGALQPFPAPGVKVEDEFGAPLMARWLFTEVLPHHFGPARAELAAQVMKHIKSRYPDAIGSEWSWSKQGFVPVYGNPRSETRPYYTGKRGTFPMHPSGSGPGYQGFSPIYRGINSLR